VLWTASLEIQIPVSWLSCAWAVHPPLARPREPGFVSSPEKY
jgi:hypothetical protein